MSKQQAGGKRWGRRLVIAAGAAMVVAGGVVLLAPTILSAMVPGMVPGMASGVITGQASIESASFSWGGPQRITGLKVLDAQRADVASVRTIEVSAGLLGLIGGNLDIGTVTLNGVKARVVRRADGTSNVQQLTKPAPAASAAPSAPPAATLPKGLRATLVIDGGEVTLDDQAAGVPGVQVALSDVALKVALADQSPIRVEAKAMAGDARERATGSVSIDLTIDRWINASGAMTPDTATVDATVDVRALPSAMLDAFAAGALAGGSFREGLGSTVDLSIKAKGGREAGDFDVRLSSSNVKADASVTLAANVLTARSPVRVEVSGAGLAGLSPGAAAATRRDGVSFDALPSVSLEVDRLRLPVPREGAALDLRNAGMVLAMSTSGMTGRVSVEPGAASRPFAVEPLSVRIDAADLSGPVRVQASTSASIAGERAGDVRADLSLAGLLDASGAPVKGVPGTVQGSVSLKGVATAIAQPLAGKLNLAEDVGPLLDATVTVATVERARAGDASTLDLDVSVDSRNIVAGASIRAGKDRVASRERGVRLAVRNPASIAGRFMDPALGFMASPSRPDSKGLEVTIVGLDAPLNEGGMPEAAALAANVEATIDGFSLVPVIDGKPGAPLDVASLRTKMSIAKGGMKGQVDGSVWHESRPATLEGTFEVARLLVNDAAGGLTVDGANLEPKGSMAIRDLPASIVRLAKAGTTTSPGTPAPVDLVRLLQGVAGETFTVTADAAAGRQGSAEQTFTAGVRSSRLRADVAGRRTVGALELSTLGARLDVEAATLQALTEAFAPEVKGLPRLASPAALAIEVSPIALPLKADGSIDLASAGVLAAKATLPGRTLVTGLTRQDASGAAVDLGPVGVEDFVIDASVPLAGVPKDGKPGEATVRMAGSLLGGEGAKAIASLASAFSTTMAGGMPTGALRAQVDVTRIDVAALERLAGREPLAASAVGDWATVKLGANVQPGPATVTGGAPDYAKATTALTMEVDAPRLKSDGPLAATISPASLRLDKPSRFTLSPEADVLNGLMKPAKGEPSMRVQEASPVTLTLDRLSLPFKSGQGAAQPLAAQMKLAMERLAMRTSDGRDVRLSGVEVATSSREAGGAGTSIDFVATAAEAQAGEAKASALQVQGSLDGLLDPSGAIDGSRATVSARGDLPAIPTALIDAFTTRDGLAIDALGPVASLKFDVDRFPLGDAPAGGKEGTVSMTASSQRASASLKGAVRDGVLVGVEPVQASVTELSRAMGGRFIDGLPLLGSFEKTAQDVAASLRVTDLTLPLSKDFSKLNAEVTFDPGEARFEASPEFAELLKLVNARGAGVVGRQLEPLRVHVKQGVATYDSWTIPLGEFRLRTEGVVDLVRNSMDVVTYVPIEALSDKALSSLKSGTFAGKVLPGVADALREVPLRTKGPLGGAGTNIDFEMVAKNAVKGIDADKLLQEGLDRLFKPRQPRQPK
jgi:hypothetical protein